MGNIGILLRGGDLLGAREERGGAKLQRLEFNGSHSLTSAQLCNIAGRRSQEKPDQVYRSICGSGQKGLYDAVRVVSR